MWCRGLGSAKLRITNHKSQIRQRGYMMITLMLALAMITLALLAVLPDIAQQIRRDREEELRHRGNSYMRAIQHFYKKFGRYPSRIEDLENTNNLRFLRKRYTDPINIDRNTGKEKDFKFLHQQDISLNNGPVLPGQSAPAGQGGFGGASGGFGGLQQGGFGGPQGGLGGFGGQSSGLQPTGAGTSPSGLGNSSSSSSSSGSSSSASQSPGNSSSGNSPDAEEDSNSTGSSSSSSNSGGGFNGPTFGGGPILGVASTSKATTIRVFYQKNHYNDWYFIYMPLADRGGLLTGPINPSMQTGDVGGLTPGQMAGGAPGQGGFGQSGFGQGLGQGLTSTGGQNQGLQPQTPAPAPQQ